MNFNLLGIGPSTAAKNELKANGAETAAAKKSATTQPIKANTDKVELSTTSTADAKGVKQDKDGNLYINVQPWGTGKDDCLTRIVKEHYGVSPYSKEGKALMQDVMASNPQIYDSGRKAIIDGQIVEGEKNSTETIIYDNEKMILPNLGKSDESTGKRDNADNGDKYNPAPGEADNEPNTNKNEESKPKSDNSDNGSKYNPAPGEADNEFPKFPSGPTFWI